MFGKEMERVNMSIQKKVRKKMKRISWSIHQQHVSSRLNRNNIYYIFWDEFLISCETLFRFIRYSFPDQHHLQIVHHARKEKRHGPRDNNYLIDLKRTPYNLNRLVESVHTRST